MSVKVLVVLSLMATASASPAPIPTVEHGGVVRGGGVVTGGGGGVVTGGGGGDIGGVIRDILGSIRGVKRSVGGILNALLKITIGSLKDVLDFIIQLVLILEVILNNVAHGLGTLCARLVAVILKIAVCVKGCPGDRGICTKAWNQKFRINGDGSTGADLIKIFKLSRVEAEYDGYVKKCTKGKGISKLPRNSIRIVLEKIYILIKIILNYNTISKDTVTDCFVHLTSITVAIGNSKKRDSGKQITRDIIPRCGKYFKKEGYTDINIYVTIIEDECKPANDDDCDWDGGDDTTPSPGGTTASSGGDTKPQADTSTQTPEVVTTKTPDTTRKVVTTQAPETTRKVVTTPSPGDGTAPGGDDGVRGGGVVTGGGGGVVTGGGGGDIGGVIRDILGSIRGVKRSVGGILNALLKITIGSLKDVLDFIIQLVLILEVILNNVAHGLGTLCARLVAVILKIAVCVKGCPGDRGICTKAWNQKFRINGDGSTGADLIKIFKLSRVEAEYDGYVKKCTKGKGISKLPRNSIRIVLEKIYILIKIILNYNTISKDTVTDCFVHLTSITVAIGNSKKRDSGKQITREIIPRCGKYFKKEGYTDINIYVTIIEDECKPANDDVCDWDGGDDTTPSPGGTTAPSGGDTKPQADTSTQTPEVVTTQTPDTTREVVTTQTPDTTREVVTTQTPDTTREVVTTQTPDTTREVVTTQTPDTTREVVTTQTPDTTREVVTTPSPGDGTTPGGDDNDDCGPSIGVIIKQIPGCTKLATAKIITEIISIRIKTMTDVINLCVKVTICLGGILDLIVTGLGSILTRMVAVIYKIGCCVYGWGDRSICTKEYNSQVGVNGDASEYKDIINLYRLQNCKTDVITIINKYTGGKDISKQTDVISIILQKILIIVDIINSGHITKQHFTICFVEMISIFGCVINSYSKGSGTAIVQKVIPVCGPHFVKQGCPDIRKEKTRIVTVVTVGNNARIDWDDIQTRSKSDDLTTDVKVVFEDKGSNPSLQQVFNLEAPSSFDGSVSFLLKLLHALGTVIDVVCNGLGKLVIRIVGLLIHYIVAILGRGRNSRSFVCQKAYFDSFGITVKSSDWADLVTGFKLGSCKQDLDAIVAAQKGKDNAVIRVILDCTSSLVSIILKGPKITESDFTDVFSYSFTIFAAFANSCKPDLGKKICERLVPICSSILEKNNYPALTAHQPNIVKKIAVCNNVKVAWVAKTTVVEH